MSLWSISLFVKKKYTFQLSLYERIFCLHYFSISKNTFNSSIFAKMNICNILSNPIFTKINTRIQLNNFWNNQNSWSQNSCISSSKACIKKAILLCGLFPIAKIFVPFSPDLLKHLWLHKKLSFPLRISSVNVTKSGVSSGFDHIYWRSHQWKT